MRTRGAAGTLLAVLLLGTAPAAAVSRSGEASTAELRFAPQAAAPGTTAGTASIPGIGAPRPDVVIFLLDDLGRTDQRIWERLPNIRQTFLEQGVEFENAFVETPLCCPGRAGWLTGQHTHNHGVIKNDVRYFNPRMTVATQLRGVGYYTFFVGKYFNEYPRIAPAVPPGWTRFHATDRGYYDYTIWNDGKPAGEYHGFDPEDYSTDVFANKAIADLRRAPASSPIFAVIAPYAPHADTTPAPRHLRERTCGSVPRWRPAHYDEADVSDKPAYVRNTPRIGDTGYDLRSTCRSLLAVDDLVGRVRAELARQGRLEDTLLLLSTDNGMNLGAHRQDRKKAPYATPIPLLAAWPAAAPFVLGRDTIADTVVNIDLAPTLCELAGCTMGPYPNGQQQPDGRSFAHLLTGLGAAPPRDAILESLPHPNGVPVPAWYAIRTTDSSTLAGTGCAAAATLGCRWHYVEYASGERELYDVANGPCWEWQPGDAGDPCELTNVARDPRYGEVRNALASRLRELKAERGDQP